MNNKDLTANHQERLHFFLGLLELTKPRVTFMVLFTGSIGLCLAPVAVPSQVLWSTLLGLVGAVGGVNALNMYLERDVDQLMQRTRMRPLPTGRLQPKTALVFGIALVSFGILLIGVFVNLIAALLTLIAVVSYALLYTPLKQSTPLALYVGAVPGALPPLIGWTAATGRIELPGLILFGIMFFWQIPHFLAIALFRKDDYANAGFLTLPVVKGDRVTKVQILLSLMILVPISLLLVPLEMAGFAYTVTALVLGGIFIAIGIQGFLARETVRWARRLFFVSLIYLTLLFAVLLIPTI